MISNISNAQNIPLLCIIGHVSLDEVISSDGTTHKHVSGAAYATGVGAALITRRVGIVSRAGTDFPQTILKSKIDYWKVDVFPGNCTSRFYLDYRQPDITRGFWGELGVGQDITHSDIPEEWISQSVVYVATMPPKQQIAIIEGLRDKGCKQIATDLLEAYVREDPALSVNVAQMVDILFVNEFELSIINSLNFKRDGLTIIKKAERGASAYLGDAVLAESVFPAEAVIDPTNAGDVFAGAFLAKLIVTNSVEKALEVAVKVGARCVEVLYPDMLLIENPLLA